MPIFMDRHDISDSVTAEDVAQLHQKDLKVQGQFGCRGITYWFDDKRKTAFCLIEAPNADAIRKMHDEAHGDVPYSVIEVDPGVVEVFLGRISDPEKAADTELNIIDDPAFRTIMVISIDPHSLTDTASFSFQTGFANLQESFAETLRKYEGNIVKNTDYHYLVSFKSVSNAVHAAVNIQKRFQKFADEHKQKEAELKVGLNAGVPVTSTQLIFEDTIKLAERMCRLVNAQVVLSSEVKELFGNENTSKILDGKGVYCLSKADENFVTELMNYADESWSDANFRVDGFTKLLGTSKSQLYRKMISITGKSPNAFIMDFRLKEAMKMLIKNAGNVSEVAFATGFSSPSYFSKCFQKRYGQIPSDFLPSQTRQSARSGATN